MYIEESYYFWRMASDLMLNHDFEILHLNEDIHEVWLERNIAKKAVVVRLHQQTYDWSNQLKQDQDHVFKKTKELKRDLIGKEIEVHNVYISEFPPVDEWSNRQEPVHLKGRKKTTIYSHYIIDNRSAKIDKIYQKLHLQAPAMTAPSEFEMEHMIHELKRSMKRHYKSKQQKIQEIFSFGKPRLTYLFIFINLAMFAWLEYQGGSTNTLTLIQYGAKYNPAILDGEWWRILSSMFLHIGFIHIAMNMLALYYLGTPVERMYGSLRFFFIYFVSGISGGIASFALSSSVAAGASGAIYGLFGALLFFGVVYKKLFFQTMGTNLLWIIALNIMMSFSIPQIDMGAHIGGLIGGFLASAIVHFPKKRNLVLQMIGLLILCVCGLATTWYGLFHHENDYDPRLQAQISQEYAKEGENERAIDIVDEALRYEESADLYFSRAYAYSQLGNMDKAYEDLKTSISLRPSFALAHYNLSVVYQHKQNREKALEHAREAVDLNPGDERFQDHLQSLENSG